MRRAEEKALQRLGEEREDMDKHQGQHVGTEVESGAFFLFFKAFEKEGASQKVCTFW